MKEKLLHMLKQDYVLTAALTLSILTSFFTLPKLSYIDFKVLILLFNLMIVVAAFKTFKLLDSIALSLLKHAHTSLGITFALVFVTFLSSMFVTNDVALITFVPLTLVVAKKAPINSLKIIIFQTLAANLGSSLTPMGNPQNLFIYSFYNITPVTFFSITLPLVILSIIFLGFLILKEEKITLGLALKGCCIENKQHFICFSILFIFILLSVFHLVDYRLTFVVTLITVFSLNRKLFRQVDYSLLLTFIAFFIFIGNLSSMTVVKTFMEGLLKTNQSTYFSSLLASQFISNVPATMLIAGFTEHYKALLLGVNIGGMGTLISSLASVISYKLYVKENPTHTLLYLKTFSVYNAIGLAIFVPLIYFLQVRL